MTTHPKKFDQTLAQQLRQKLDADPFINFLKSRTLFHNIAPAQLPLELLEEISRSVQIIRLARNRQLELQRPPDFIYEIVSGYVKIYDRAPSAAEGEGETGDDSNPPALLAWRVPGELLGDFKFAFPASRFSDSIIATDECRLLKVPVETLHSLGLSHPQVYLNLAGNLASKAIKTRIRAQLLRLPNIRCMIARLFIEFLAERGYDEAVDEGARARVVNGTFHIRDIAAFLGYEYRQTQTGVHDLIKEDLIAHYRGNKKSGRFVIRSEEKLRRYLELNAAGAD
ncbi:MAG TPA: hypothetical protein VGX48_10560 [Pyrinomonadaceae bacterium]|jgi:CRP-like cAMP-binding protein|nr:hypothetical protein [Pyrinomonadaceae bacterium]